ncbi:hypothetical protein [Pseudoflavitalea rhizosphaerae]|uniref:hypothetical protein n=1 Tax=Pseudoflavitalea rhizosphaerae TaxID=1884793 RepID=UPI000F8E12E5|nr:hypothetical protein [Pseudoflavitalea rhizosphaerae]
MQEIVDFSKRPPGKPTDWIPITIALSIFFAAAIAVLFFIEPPQPPGGPLQRGPGQSDSAMILDTPQEYRNQ